MSIVKMGHHTDMEFFKCFARARFPFLAVQDASFYTVGKIARKNLATSSRIFSCYPSGHINSRKLVCYL